MALRAGLASAAVKYQDQKNEHQGPGGIAGTLDKPTVGAEHLDILSIVFAPSSVLRRSCRCESGSED